MTHSLRRRGRAALLAVGLAATLGLASAAPAQAVDVPVDCTTLQTGLTNAVDGDVIILDGVCDGAFTIPAKAAGANIVLKGNPADGPGDDGFDRDFAAGNPSIRGNDVRTFTFDDLFFQESTNTGNGGAMEITGLSEVRILNSSFTSNRAPGTSGGAVAIDTTAPNATTLLEDNLFSGNAGLGNGGAVFIDTNATSAVVLNRNQFLDNRLTDDFNAQPPAADHRGGGVYLKLDSASATQFGNLFQGNDVESIGSGGSYGGGGEWVQGGTLNSTNDQFLSNTVPGQPLIIIAEHTPGQTPGDSEGGGLGAEDGEGSFNALNFVAAGNSVGDRGEGGGVHVGDPSTFDFVQATIVNNTVGPGGQNASLDGTGDDVLDLENSIVFGNTVNGATVLPDFGGFDTGLLDVDYTDACESPGTPYTGDGNICADPLLVGPEEGGIQNVHQTANSPTIDKGLDQNFFDEGPFEGAGFDYENGARPTDGDGDGHTTDMGADESPAFVPGTGAAAGAAAAGPSLPAGAAASICGRREISLVRADQKGRRVTLRGLVAKRLAGRSVEIRSNYARGKMATITSNQAGEFTANVKAPSKADRIRARYRANVGSIRSIPLKLPQSLAPRGVQQRPDGTVTLRGKVKRSVLGKRNPVIVRRLVCGRYREVGRAKPDRNGDYAVTFKPPNLAEVALYRAESRVLRKPGSSTYVTHYARAISIRLNEQTG